MQTKVTVPTNIGIHAYNVGLQLAIEVKEINAKPQNEDMELRQL